MSRRFFIIIEILAAAFLLASPMASPATEPLKLDSLKVGSKVYHQVIILGANETDLYFRHSAGIANVKLKYLSPGLQKRFGYDAKAAAAAEKREIQEDSAFRAALARSIAARAQKARQADREAAANTYESLADPVSEESLLKRPGPTLTTIKWLGDAPETEGKAVLIFFWTTWSLPCRKAIPEMNTYQKDFQDQLVVVGISTQEEKEVTDFSDVKIDFPLGLDPKGKLAKIVGLTSVPQALVMNADGIVTYVGHPGALNDSILKKLLAKPAE